VNTLPSPTTLVTVRSPPILRAKERLIASLEPRALGGPRQIRPNLNERLEDRFELVLGDADAGVAHDDLDVLSRSLAGDIQRLPRVGKFDGIQLGLRSFGA